MFTSGCLGSGLLLALFNPSRLQDFGVFVVALPFSLSPSFLVLVLVGLWGKHLLLLPYEVWQRLVRFGRASFQWVCGLVFLVSLFISLVCLCNPRYAFQVVCNVGWALFHLLPYSSCVSSSVSLVISVSTKLCHLSSVLPLSSFVSMLDQGLTLVLHVVSTIHSSPDVSSDESYYSLVSAYFSPIPRLT